MNEDNTTNKNNTSEEKNTEKESKLKELKLDQEIASLEQQIAESRKATLEAQIPAAPDIEGQPEKGKITVDDKFGYIAELTAYKSMGHKAEYIASKINESLEKENARILIVDSLDFCLGDVQLFQINNQIEKWENALTGQIKEIDDCLAELKRKEVPLKKAIPYLLTKGVGGFISAANIIAGSAAEIVAGIAKLAGFFSVDYELKGREINITDNALHALVAGHIKKEHSVYILNFHRIESSKLIENYDKLIEKRNNLSIGITELTDIITMKTKSIEELKKDIKILEEKLKKLKSPKDDQKIAMLNTELKDKEGQIKEIKTKIIPAEESNKKASELIKNFDEFNKMLTTAPADKKYSPLSSAVIRSYFKEKEITHLLYLTVTSSGGHTITSTGLLRRSKVSFQGGGVFTFVLADCEGKIIAADSAVGASYVKFNLNQDNLPPIKIWEAN